ncbi:Gfo/Idh/MocA family protein [Aeoliella mucimassa]|uniref:Inositol 2-dehydrogenase/D-chiro-inositol 3-dehydrogenase n=1 Tax=Aeoliella mucimassa TaxID=2527972 RepID=A0A518AQI7_9BACT|nr:Gfo/Idh/MocA family oxidoreductase [Aeoliella mucimassa]QDU56977.1 Inositol 2-dehydrogenase/D-chiro-inositol 3-dehydrogenase [Aeoliella mucimassa]
MATPNASNPNRRGFLKTVGAASVLSTVPRHVFAQHGSEATIRVALVGCGGRGTGAAADALNVKSAKLKLVAMADVFDHRLNSSYNTLTQVFADQADKVDVPADRRFVGFDAYRHALDQLRPGDIAIFATPLAFRGVHFQYAIEKGVNVFMEKPLSADGPTSLRLLELAKQASENNLKCGVGLMVRHCRARRELHDRIANGEIGDIILMRGYRMHGPVVTCFSTPKPEGREELMWQIERFHSFLWSSGGLFSDFNIHQIDELSWMKNAWPVKAMGIGGRHYRGDYIDQNFDSYGIEYTYEDGAKLYFDSRIMPGCKNDMSSIAHGSKGSAVVSHSGHTPGRVRICSGQNQDRKDTVWAYPQPEQNPYQLEWDDLVEAILKDTPYNEVPRGVEASVVTSMGRMAAHTGQEITFEQMLNCSHEFAPGLPNFSKDGPAPVMPDSEGRYPVPMPGIVRDTEYLTATTQPS